MQEKSKDGGKPGLTTIDRRRLLKLLACGGGAATAVVLGNLIPRSVGPPRPTALDDVPVRNPAFRAVPGAARDHMVLYCQSDTNQYVAYDLNALGYLIWRSCIDHSSFLRGRRKTAAQIAADVADEVDAPETRSFIELMDGKGLVFRGGGANQSYFVYEEPH